MRIVGLISGTSVDGIDAALVELVGTVHDLEVTLIAGETYPYPARLQEQILQVCAGQPLAIAHYAELDDAIAQQLAGAALAIQQGHSPADLIGSHGQTVYHRPPHGLDLGYSLQLGRGDLIAHLTQIPTVSNFRVADIAAGGQGAPLVSPVDVCLLGHPTRHRSIQNIGGIGNVTFLPARSRASGDYSVLGFDTGPGNTLLDLAVQRFSQGQMAYDEDGRWAATGTPCLPLVEHWLQQPYFHCPPPKSTGRELFGWDYLQQCLTDAEPYRLSEADCLATLTELTAASIAQSYQAFLPEVPQEVLLCGGGSRNGYLRQRLQQRLESVPVVTTDEVGLSASFKEAIAFAVLAYWRWLNLPGNLPEVTGAKCAVPLGEIHLVL